MGRMAFLVMLLLLQDGWGIIDGGAIKNRHIQAIEVVMKQRVKNPGQAGVQGADMMNRPILDIADSGEALCISIVDLWL